MSKITLKAARVNQGLTQKEVAKELNVSTKTICFWEKGIRMPKVIYIDKLCDLYKVSYDDINFLVTSSL